MEEAGDQEAMDTLLTLGGVNNSRRRVRRAPKRLADEEEGPQWGTPEKPIFRQRRCTGRLKMRKIEVIMAGSAAAAIT